MRIKIDRIVYPGKSMGKSGGKVVFTDHGLSGEEAEIEVIKDAKNHIQGRTVSVTGHSPHRVSPRCTHYMVCAPYQYIEPVYQSELKARQIKDILGHHLSLDLEPVFRPSPRIWGYRNKAVFKIIWEEGSPSLAYNLPRSTDRFIRIDGCYLASENMNVFLKELIRVVKERSLRWIDGVIVRENTKKEILAGIYHTERPDAEDALLALADIDGMSNVAGLVLVDRVTGKRKTMRGNEFFIERLRDKDLCIGIGSFFQVNTGQLSVLSEDIEKELALTGTETLADLYCGVGTFGVLLSPKAGRVIGVESDEENFYYMKRTIGMNGITGFDARLSDCKNMIRTLFEEKVDAVIVDPPRKGMDPAVCLRLADSGPGMIIYVSCDPATLTRDMKTLMSSYDVTKVYAYDFFPHTPHIETMTVMRRAGRKTK